MSPVPPRFYSYMMAFGFLLAGAQSAPALRAEEAPKPETRSVLDFKNMPDQPKVWGSWGGLAGQPGHAYISKENVLSIGGEAGTEGGCGASNISVDIDGCTYLLVACVIGDKNTAKQLAVSLRDADGTTAKWYLPLGDLPKGKTVPVLLKLAEPHALESDKSRKEADEIINLSQIRGWQITGDYSKEPTRYHLVIAKVGALKVAPKAPAPEAKAP